MSSILSQLYEDGYMEARSVEQTAVFQAAEAFARVEGILAADRRGSPCHQRWIQVE